MRWRVIVVKKPVTAHTRVIPKILFKISQTAVFGIPRSFSSSRKVNRRSPSIAKVAPAEYYPMFLSSKVGQNENHCQQKLTIIPLFYSCFAHTLISIGLLHHLNSFRTRFFELKTKCDANSLILFFSHF